VEWQRLLVELRSAVRAIVGAFQSGDLSNELMQPIAKMIFVVKLVRSEGRSHGSATSISA